LFPIVTCRPLPFGVFQALVAAKIRGVAKALKPLFSTPRLPRRKEPLPRPVLTTSVAARVMRRWGGYSSRNCKGVVRKRSIHSRRGRRLSTHRLIGDRRVTLAIAEKFAHSKAAASHRCETLDSLPAHRHSAAPTHLRQCRGAVLTIPPPTIGQCEPASGYRRWQSDNSGQSSSDEISCGESSAVPMQRARVLTG
jgi:hypothetical protein